MNAKSKTSTSHISMSFEGDEHLRHLLRALSGAKGVSTGRLLRIAVDIVYGDDLSTLESLFHANSVEGKQHLYSPILQQNSNGGE